MKSLSICIPCDGREQTLALVLESVVEQARVPGRDPSVEVVIGTGETSAALQTLLEDFTSDLEIRVVPVFGKWTISRGRNAAIRGARGKVLLLIDADIWLATGAIDQHMEAHAQADRFPQLCLGSVRGYQKAEALASDPVSSKADFESALPSLERIPDRRMATSPLSAPLPWALCWTGHVSVPRAALETHGGLFDETFVGWGMEDQEWALRLLGDGLGLCWRPDIKGVHIPHKREVARNLDEEVANLRRFLAKHPVLGVELVSIYGDVEANARYEAVLRAIRAVRPSEKLGDLARTGGDGLLLVGPTPAAVPEGAVVLDPTTRASVSDGRFQLLGARTPFAARSFRTAFVNPLLLDALDDRLRACVLSETRRVAECVRVE